MRRALLPAAFVGTVSLSLNAAALERAIATDGVRTCPRYGPGFVEVPGTTNCIRIGGRVSSTVETGGRRLARDRGAGWGTRAERSIDARTDTDLGPLRLVWRSRVADGRLVDGRWPRN